LSGPTLRTSGVNASATIITRNKIRRPDSFIVSSLPAEKISRNRMLVELKLTIEVWAFFLATHGQAIMQFPFTKKEFHLAASPILLWLIDYEHAPNVS
jgi:hypothetical protein